MFNRFSKPNTPTTDRVQLKQKALAFLNKNYIRIKPGEGLPDIFYMLENNSINGIAQYQKRPMDVQYNKNGGNVFYTSRPPNTKYLQVIYKNFQNQQIIERRNITLYTSPTNENQFIWYRTISVFGNSASNVVLGGKAKSRRALKRSHTLKRRRFSH